MDRARTAILDYLGSAQDELMRSLTNMRHADGIRDLTYAVIGALENDGTVFFIGNGGSAATANHWAAELTGRFRMDRRPLSAISLCNDTAALTAIANDYGFENVFTRQLEGLAKSNDVLVALSTSGKSPNIKKALATAKRLGMESFLLTGGDEYMGIRSNTTSHVQELHDIVMHTVCHAVERQLFGEKYAA